MSLSPEGRRRLIRHLGLNPEDQKDFSDSLDRLMDDVSKCAPEHLFIKPSRLGLSYSMGSQFFGRIERVNSGGLLGKSRNWPSETTLNTNRLNGRPVASFGFSVNPPAARRSPERLKEAFSWWFARAETRRIIERMMQK